MDEEKKNEKIWKVLHGTPTDGLEPVLNELAEEGFHPYKLERTDEDEWLIVACNQVALGKRMNELMQQQQAEQMKQLLALHGPVPASPAPGR